MARQRIPRIVAADEKGGGKTKTVEALTAVPAPPPFLSANACEEWHALLPDLIRHGQVNKADLNALAAYCETWAQYVDITQKIQKDGHVTFSGNGMVRTHPYVTIQDRLLKSIRGFCADFGFNPAARNRMDAAPGGDTSADDEFNDFLDS
jgi:P27 family predicted phage terminase small subunit